MKTFFLGAIIQDDIKATGHRDHKLMQVAMRMRTPICAAWDVIKVIYPLDVEWDVLPTFHKGKIAPRVLYFW